MTIPRSDHKDRSSRRRPEGSTFFVSAALGLEHLLAQELTDLGALATTVRAAGVRVQGDLALAYRAILWSRLASRVLWPLSRFEVSSPSELYDACREVPWHDHLDAGGTLAVRTTCVGVAPDTPQFLSLRVKDAVCDALRDHAGLRPSVDVERPDLRVHLHVQGTRAEVSLDLSGTPLHRRGYRRQSADAPLREDLATAVLLRSAWMRISKGGGAFLDPMCGSGTLPIEAALLAADVAPGLKRDHYGFSGWLQHDRERWHTLLAEADERREVGLRSLPPIHGSDRDRKILHLARANAERAGLAAHIRFDRRDVRDAERPDAPTGLVATNPPYGLRIGSPEALRGTYRELGERLLQEFGGWDATVLTGDRELGREIPLRPRRSGKLHNGNLECVLLRYRIHAERRS